MKFLGLFSNHYSRPGPGVNKNEPKKKAFFRFFELLFRKFWNLIQLNLIFCVPVFVALLLGYFLSRFTTLSLILYAPLILISPFVAGLTFVTRNYAREEHAFVFSDFIEAVQKNWLYFLINGLILFAVYFILQVAMSYYQAQVEKNWFFMLPLSLCIGVSVLFGFAQYYIPVMIITFNLKLKDIYKNAMIFSIIGLWRNLLLTVILAVIAFGIYLLMFLSPLTFALDLALLVFILFAFCMFLINFTVYPLVDKVMIQPYQEKDDSEDADPDPDFKD